MVPNVAALDAAATYVGQAPSKKAIKRLLSSGLTYELDAFANKDLQYLTKKYLPRKLKEREALGAVKASLSCLSERPFWVWPGRGKGLSGAIASPPIHTHA